MQDNIKPQIQAALQATFDLTNLAFSQVERLTELSLAQCKVSAELAHEQASSLMEVKDPAAALELFKSQLETSAKSLAGFSTTAFELSETFQSESAAFVEGHFSEVHANANKAIGELLKNAPQGSESAVTAVKAAIDATNKAIAEAHAAAKKSSALAKESLAEFKKHAPQAAAKAPVRRKARA